MESPRNKNNEQEDPYATKTFPVPLVSNEIYRNLSNSTKNTDIYKDDKIKIALDYYSKGNLEKAAEYYQYLINENSNESIVFLNYGIILKQLGKINEAELFLRKAIDINPNLAQAHNSLGNILKDHNKLEEAQNSLNIAIKLKPNYAIAHNNLGNILKDLGKLEDAEKSIRKSIELEKDKAEFHYNLGNILRDQKKLKLAENSINKAIELRPNFPDAYFNLSYLELIQGNYQSGLEHYEFRFKKKNPSYLNGKPKIRRIGNEQLEKGEKLLIISEQGLGDTIQYMRYIPYLKAQGINVSFCAQKKLHSLIKESNIDQNPLDKEEVNKVSEGKWIPLLSIPKYLKVSPNNPIISEKYINTKTELYKKWKTILSTEKKPIIGLNWQGNPLAEKRLQKGRSLPLETFSKIAEVNNCKFISLQKGFGSEQLNNCSFKNKFVKCQKDINIIWDFLEISAVILNCDIIITSDTSVAHLSGGLGKSTWLLLKDLPDWRWGNISDKTFWYPSIRIFRQKEIFNWQEVINRVSQELNNLKIEE